MTETTELQVILALVVLVGIIRLPRSRRLAGILASLFLLALPFLPLDGVDAWMAGPAAESLHVLTVILIGIAFFTWRPRQIRDY